MTPQPHSARAEGAQKAASPLQGSQLFPEARKGSFPPGYCSFPHFLCLQQGVIHTPPMISSQQGHCKQPVGAHWSLLPCGSLSQGLKHKRKLFLGSFKSQAQSRSTQSPGSCHTAPAGTGGWVRCEDVGLGAKEVQAWAGAGGHLMLPSRLAGSSLCCILPSGICANSPCGSSA